MYILVYRSLNSELVLGTLFISVPTWPLIFNVWGGFSMKKAELLTNCCGVHLWSMYC